MTKPNLIAFPGGRKPKPTRLGPLLCRVGWHDWAPWQETGGGALMKNGLKIGYFFVQERVCSRCNKHQYLREDV